MGLDMYLNVRHFFLYNELEEANSKFQTAWGDLAKLGNLKQVEIEAAYWRKANAIHNWFVNNVQKGRDDCGQYEVSREQLTALRDTCEKVMENHSLASELLPPVSGFFFGSTEIDEGYFDDIKYTHERLTELLAVLPEDRWCTTVTYQSSW